MAGVSAAFRAAQDYLPCRELKVGDRVIRQKIVGNKGAGFLHGEVVKIRPRLGACSLADIRWDSDTTVIDPGYLVTLLTPETFD